MFKGYKILLSIMTMTIITSCAKSITLWDAIATGNTVAILKCIDRGIDINKTSDSDYSYRTPLQLAAFLNEEDAVKILLNNKANPNVVGEEQPSLLHQAVIDDQPTILKELVNHNAELEVKGTEGETPLHLAAYYNRETMVLTLLKGKAEVNAVDDVKHTPLHLAADQGNLAIVEILVSNGADVNAEDLSGNTPMDLASLSRKDKVFTYLANLKRAPRATKD